MARLFSLRLAMFWLALASPQVLAQSANAPQIPVSGVMSMPLVSPEAAKAALDGRIVPPSTLDSLPRPRAAARATGLDPRALGAPAVYGHELPVGSTAASGLPRADFAIGRGPARAISGASAQTLGAQSAEPKAAASSPPSPAVALRASAAAAPSCTQPSAEPEIAALARALNYDLGLIYEYIYYDIDFLPSFGSKKGALGTYLDRRGTNIDQNTLFVALLRQSCIPANFRYGTVTYSADTVANWFGVQNDAGVLATVVGNGGFPGCVQLTSGGACVNSGGKAAFVKINTVYTEATVGATTYRLDPSFKSHVIYQPIALASAMGYTQSGFLNGVLSGSSAVSGLPAGSASLKGLNKGQLTSLLNGYSANLAASIRANASSSTTKQVFGGKEISSANFGATLSGNNTVYADLPNSLRTSYTVTVSNAANGSSPTITVNLFADQIAGKRLTLTYTASKQPVLSLDGTALATGAAATGANQTVSMTVSNPYPAGRTFATSTARASVGVGGTYAVMLVAGELGRDTLTRFQNALGAFRQAGNAALSDPVLSAGLAAIGSAYLSQSSRAQLLADGMFGTVTVLHNAMGIAGYSKGGSYVDFPAQLSSISSAAPGLTQQAFYGSGFAKAFFNSSLESTAVTQLQANPAVSTVRAFDLANALGAGFIEATPSNWAALKPTLTTWNAGDLTAIGSFLSATPTGRVVLPQNGRARLNQWGGSGWFEVNTPGGLGLSVAYKISGSYNGGYSSYLSYNSFSSLSYSYSAYQPTYSFLSYEPIDLLSGAYTLDRSDLKVGSADAPFSLELKPSYSSARGSTKGVLGYGWTHNFATTVFVDSDSYEAFGDSNALNAVPTVVAIFAARDLMTAPGAPMTNIAAGSLVTSWMMDQLVNNALTVGQGEKTRKFMKIPTADGKGQYVPPPGDATNLVANADGSFTATDKTGTVISIGSDGKLTQWKDANGNIITYAYAGSGASKQLASVTNGMGRTLSFAYNAQGLLASAGDGTRTVTYGYDGSGNLVSVTDPTGAVTKYVYDTAGRMTQLFYPSFPTTAFMTNTYDGAGRVSSQADALGNVWTYLFANMKRGQEVNPASGSHVLGYDRRGNATRDVDQTGAVTTMAYDGQSRLVLTTYPAGDSVAQTYDARHNVLRKTTTPFAGTIDIVTGAAPTPIVESWTYDASFSKPLTATDGKGNVTTNAYDGRGNLTSVTSPAVAKPGVANTANPVKTYVYNTRGLVTSQADEEGRLTSFSYDARTFDLLSQVVDAGSGRLNLATFYSYDAVGNRITTTDPRGNTTTTAYDLMRRPTQVTPPAPFSANVTATSYDADGRVTAVKRATGAASAPWRTTTTAYNAAGKPILVTAPDGTWKSSAYDSVMRLASETFSSGRRVTYSYDPASRPAVTTDMVGGTLDPSITVNLGSVTREARTYYGNGTLATLADGKGNTLTYNYDGFKRVKKLAFPNGSFELYGYDANGNKVVTQTRAGGSIWLDYDALNRVVKKRPSGQPAIVSGYDYSGRLLAMKEASESGQYNMIYDTAGRQTGETRADISGSIAWTLDGNGNRTSLAWPEGGTLAYATTSAYDALNRLTDIYEGPASQGVKLGHYDYDALSQRTRLVYGGTPARASGLSSTYSYTAAGQLSNVTHAWPALSVGFDSTYNQDHQRASLTTPAGWLWSTTPGTSATYTTNALNQYASLSGTAFSYDKNGNLTGDGVWSFAYDTENRLISATKSGVSASYAYDPRGRRKAKTVTTTANGATTTATTLYLSAGDQEITEYGVSAAGVSLNSRYVFGPGLDEPLAIVSGNLATRYFFHADPLGSTVAATNAGNLTIYRNKYTAYGIGGPSNVLSLQYAGRRLDGETGLYYNRARMYSPVLGRFLQPDPIKTDGGINLYAYVKNDPLNATDPTGLASMLAPSYLSNFSSINSFAFPNTVSGSLDRLSFEDHVRTDFGLFQLASMDDYLPRNLGEQLVLEDAMNGGGTQIMGTMNFPAGGKKYRVYQNDIDLHYMCNPAGICGDYKFKR